MFRLIVEAWFNKLKASVTNCFTVRIVGDWQKWCGRIIWCSQRIWLTICNLIQVDVNMHVVKNIGSHCTLCIGSELFWFFIFLVVMYIFENEFNITDFVTFALIVLSYCLGRVKNKCMRTTVNIDSTNLKRVGFFS